MNIKKENAIKTADKLDLSFSVLILVGVGFLKFSFIRTELEEQARYETMIKSKADHKEDYIEDLKRRRDQLLKKQEDFLKKQKEIFKGGDKKEADAEQAYRSNVQPSQTKKIRKNENGNIYVMCFEYDGTFESSNYESRCMCIEKSFKKGNVFMSVFSCVSSLIGTALVLFLFRRWVIWLFKHKKV